MAEAPPVRTSLSRQAVSNFVNHLYRLIHNGSLEDVREIFEDLPREQYIRILNSSIGGNTPLCYAIEEEQIEISRYLLELSLNQGRREMNEIWKKTCHPLSVAIVARNRELFRMIAVSLHDLNERIYGPFTPLTLAVASGEIEHVKLIRRLGADINSPDVYGASPLMASVSYKNLCNYLIASNANVNHRDIDGDTALHLAVSGKHLDTLILLVNSNANITIRNHDEITPLMLASVHLNEVAAMYLREKPAYSELEKIEALEILGACCACAEKPGIHYWLEALKRRADIYPKTSRFPPHGILDLSREFTTVTGLVVIGDNTLLLSFQGTLVIERIYGRESYLYLHFLLKTAVIAKGLYKLKKVRQLVNYIKELCLTLPANTVASCQLTFMSLFSRIADDGPKSLFNNGGFDIFELIVNSTKSLWNDHRNQLSKTLYLEHVVITDVVDTSLKMASTIQTMELSEAYESRFREVVKELVAADPRVKNRQSLLHRVIKCEKVETFRCVKLCRLLLESGADPDTKDYFLRTPFVYAVKHANDLVFRDIIDLLMEFNSHLNCLNVEGFSSLHFNRSVDVPIYPRNPRNLLCLASEAILDNRLSYREVLPASLKDFIDLHDSISVYCEGTWSSLQY